MNSVTNQDFNILTKKLLKDDNILIGLELEDGEFEGNIRKVMIRPINSANFKELWTHGKEHCSKMIIYLRRGKLLVERRPDLKNYDTFNDLMYHDKDLIKAARAFEKYYIEQMGEVSAKDSFKNTKRVLNSKIEQISSNLIAIATIEKGSYNILYQD